MFAKTIISLSIMLFAFVAISFCQEISNEYLLHYAMKDYDKRKMINKTISLGFHNSKKVVVIHPCADICPKYLKRVIYYEVPFESCSIEGGVLKKIRMTSGRTSAKKEFCIPEILNNNWSDIKQ